MRSTDICSHEKILSGGFEFGMSLGLGFCLTQARPGHTSSDGAGVYVLT